VFEEGAEPPDHALGVQPPRVVKKLFVQQGQTVEREQLLVEIEEP
jgi:multidrug efflux pump subunit AcrA (membrane-fusion protein)